MVRALEKAWLDWCRGGQGTRTRLEEEREEKWQETKATDYRPSFCCSWCRKGNRTEREGPRT